MTPVLSYDAMSIAGALATHFAVHGAPLVLRLDRCAAHTAPEVLEVTKRFGVLILQGPPHHPGYYGQLERQNREHRAWLDAVGPLDDETLAREIERMRESLNTLIPRRSLGWCTPHDLWTTRRVVDIDRAALHEEVNDRAAYLQRKLEEREVHLGFHRRFAIEQALTSRGYLECSTPRWC